jgi:hypothetical protein
MKNISGFAWGLFGLSAFSLALTAPQIVSNLHEPHPGVRVQAKVSCEDADKETFDTARERCTLQCKDGAVLLTCTPR